MPVLSPLFSLLGRGILYTTFGMVSKVAATYSKQSTQEACDCAYSPTYADFRVPADWGFACLRLIEHHHGTGEHEEGREQGQ